MEVWYPLSDIKSLLSSSDNTSKNHSFLLSSLRNFNDNYNGILQDFLDSEMLDETRNRLIDLPHTNLIIVLILYNRFFSFSFIFRLINEIIHTNKFFTQIFYFLHWFFWLFNNFYTSQNIYFSLINILIRFLDEISQKIAEISLHNKIIPSS